MSDDEHISLRFFYIKAQSFRVVHVDGVIGGITPKGLLHLAVYSERAAIPQVLVHNLSPSGQLGDPVAVEGKQGIVREIDSDLLMTKETAVEIRDWLTARIVDLEKAERLIEQQNKRQQTGGGEKPNVEP